MKKTTILLFVLFSFFNASSQIISPNCWYPALPDHCTANQEQMDNYSYSYYDQYGNLITINTFALHAVYQANENCVYLQWNFPLYNPIAYLLGLKVRISGGGIDDLITIYDCIAFQNAYGNYTYTDPLSNKVVVNIGLDTGKREITYTINCNRFYSSITRYKCIKLLGNQAKVTSVLTY